VRLFSFFLLFLFFVAWLELILITSNQLRSSLFGGIPRSDNPLSPPRRGEFPRGRGADAARSNGKQSARRDFVLIAELTLVMPLLTGATAVLSKETTGKLKSC
jgi:hypothetical protein